MFKDIITRYLRLKEMQEKHEQIFTQEKINDLKKQYAKILVMQPNSKESKEMHDLVDGLSRESMKKLIDAKIPYVSQLAASRIKYKTHTYREN